MGFAQYKVEFFYIFTLQLVEHILGLLLAIRGISGLLLLYCIVSWALLWTHQRPIGILEHASS